MIRVYLPVRAGVHPVQAPGHAQAGLVEPGHLGSGDVLFDQTEEFAESLGGAAGHGGHGALRDRGAEQLGPRLGGALLGQELPRVPVKDDRGDPRPVLHRRAYPLRRGTARRGALRRRGRPREAQAPSRNGQPGPLLPGPLHRDRRHLPRGPRHRQLPGVSPMARSSRRRAWPGSGMPICQTGACARRSRYLHSAQASKTSRGCPRRAPAGR